MKKSFRGILVLIALFLTVAFGVILANQTLQLALFAERFHPAAGDAVFWALVFTYAALLLVPLYLLLRLPRSLIPPDEDSGPAFEAHLAELRKRLGRNPRTRALPVPGRKEIEEALGVLDTDADALIRGAGSRAFLSTAISQNGALDSLLVLAIQSRLIWDVAHVYSQRPSLRDMLYLYSNVLTTAFIAGELDDAELAEITQPIFSTVLGSAASAVPGLQVASSIFTNSVLSGTANAFLTLRVGIIAQEYSRALVRPKKGLLRRSAVARAAGMLGGIATDGAAKVWTALAGASRRTVTGAVTGVGRRMKSAGGAVMGKMPFKRTMEPEEGS